MPLLHAIEEALKGGVRAIQLREKDLSNRELLDVAYKMRRLTEKYNARLFINDRVDVAMCVNADGVHLGQLSIPVYAIRKIVSDKFMIGVSAHNLQEATAAVAGGSDFITFGPVYHTPSKLKYGEPVGVESLRRVKEKLFVPIFGIGGIKHGNIKDVMQSGVHGVAVISGILRESDVKRAVGSYLKILGEKS